MVRKEIQHLKVQSLRTWAKQLKSVIKKQNALDVKIKSLEDEKTVLNKQVEAYNSLVESTFGQEFAGLSINDLVVMQRVEGADIITLNPKYIITEEIKNTNKDGKVTTKTKYYFNLQEDAQLELTREKDTDVQPLAESSKEENSNEPDNLPVVEEVIGDIEDDNPFDSNDLVDSL